MTERIIRIKVDASGAKREIGQIDGQMRNLGGTTDKLQTQLTRVASAIAAAFSVRQIVAYADAYTNIQNRLRVVTSSTEQLTRVTAELLQVANATRAEYETTATLFSTLARSTEELAISEERLIAITSTINKSFAVQGANAQSAANAIRQLAQGLDAGALRGDEFNSVAEQAPAILRAVQKELGVSRGELRDLAAEGEITAELLIRSIEGYAETVDREYAKTNRTFEQSSVVAKNNAIAFVGSSKLIQEATAAAGNTLVALSNNLETVGEVLTFVAAVVAGRFIGALSASAVALINNSRAALAAKVQTDALGVSIARTSVAANAGAIAARGLTAAFAALGGPLGVILIASTALALFSSSSDDAKEKSEELKTEVENLTAEFSKLNEQGKQLTLQKLVNEQVRVNKELQEASKRYNELEIAAKAAAESGRGGFSDASAVARLSKAAGEVKRLSDEAGSLAEKQRAIFELGLPPEGSLLNPGEKAVSKLREIKGELQQLLNFQLDNLQFDSGLFGGLEGVGQDDQTAARINSRIEGLKLETQTISSELALQQAVRQGFLTQEQADLDLQTATKIQKAITERELLLAEKSITDEQIAATEMAFQEQLTSISEQYAEQRLQVRRAEFSQQISMYSNYANAALALGDAFGSKSEKANKRRRRVGVIVDTAAGIGRAFAENNFYTALGISALIAANGAAQLSAINSAGGGGGSISGASGGSVALPTQPTAAASVQTLEIVGLREEIERLEAADGFVSTQFVAKVLDKIDSANRLRGEG